MGTKGASRKVRNLDSLQSKKRKKSDIETYTWLDELQKKDKRVHKESYEKARSSRNLSITTKRYLRKKVGHRCQWCNIKAQELDIHHIIPLSQGGSNYLDNLVVVCKKCHLNAHGKFPGVHKLILQLHHYDFQ